MVLPATVRIVRHRFPHGLARAGTRAWLDLAV